MVLKITEAPSRMATWWVTKNEANDIELMNSLKPQIKEYQRKGYMTIRFVSGDRDPVASTYQLMKHNFELNVTNSCLAPNNGCEVVFIYCQLWNIILVATVTFPLL